MSRRSEVGGRRAEDRRRRTEDGGRRSEDGGRTSDVRHRMGERRAQSRREKRLNIFLFKILASLRLCARNISYRFRPNGMGGCRQLSKLIQALDPHTEGKD